MASDQNVVETSDRETTDDADPDEGVRRVWLCWRDQLAEVLDLAEREARGAFEAALGELARIEDVIESVPVYGRFTGLAKAAVALRVAEGIAGPPGGLGWVGPALAGIAEAMKCGGREMNAAVF